MNEAMPSVHYLNETNILIFLLQVLLLLGLSRALGEVLRRIHQPPFPAEILIGIVLGPTILGRYFPAIQAFIFPPDVIQQSMLETVTWIGVFFLLLQTGLEIDFSSAWRQRGDALKIAFVDVIVPMAIAFFPSLFLADEYLVDPHHRVEFAVFIATAMTISAMPVAARALHDLKLLKTEMGFLIMSALSVNDIIGWLIFTVVLGLFTQAQVDLLRIFLVLISTVGFTFACMTVGRRFANFMIGHFKRDNMPEPGSSLTFIVILGLFCGWFTQWIGIHALFGFFIAGIVAGEAQALSERTRQIISQMVFSIFVPLFFANIGLKLDFFSNFDWFLVSFICIVGVFGRFAGAWLGTLWTSTPKENRLAIAIAHTPGGAMEVVVGVVALEHGLITEKVFIAIVVGAIFSSVIYGPWMSWAINRRKKIPILEFFSKDLVVPELKATNRDGAIQELCDLVGADFSINPQELFKQVKEREETMGTALEGMVAIPHARIKQLHRPVIALGRSVSGLEWNSPDGMPTHLIFMILVPDHIPDINVQILRAIATVMSDERSRLAFLLAKDRPSQWRLVEKQFSFYQLSRLKA